MPSNQCGYPVRSLAPLCCTVLTGSLLPVALALLTGTVMVITPARVLAADGTGGWGYGLGRGGDVGDGGGGGSQATNGGAGGGHSLLGPGTAGSVATSGGGGGGGSGATGGVGATGTSGSGDGGDGGAHGSVGAALPNTSGTDGANGANSSLAGGGGGGGGFGGVVTGPVTGPSNLSASVSGGNGGSGGGNDNVDDFGSGGGGGGGGIGVVFIDTVDDLVISGSVEGGDGGDGATAVYGGGGGGGGGHGVRFDELAAGIVVSGNVSGGDGGNGGDASSIGRNGGDGGNGGSGMIFSAGGTVEIGATVTGGHGGIAGVGGNLDGTAGAGGAGIVGNDLTVINSGTISGGIGGGARANAIEFTNGINRLELRAGSTIIGNVLAGGTTDAFALDGTASGTIDVSTIGDAAQFRGFETFEKSGTSTWTLTGTTTAVTPWTIRGGVLAVSTDSALGAASSSLVFDGGTLQNAAGFTTTRNITLEAGGGTFQTDANLTVDGVITGPGTLTKTGTGTLSLNGANTYRGLTTVDAGTLIVGDNNHATASLAGNVTVDAGGTLGGIGTVGTTTIASGGTIAPGNSIGTMTVNGNIVFEGGSTFEAEINPALESDLIDASGTATINGGAVYALKAGGVYTPGSRWTIMRAEGGVTGEFETLDQNMPFVDLALAYDSNNVYIAATRNQAAFCDVAVTVNQCATGDGLESTGGGNTVYDAVAALPDQQMARHALDALSGEIHASARTALIEDSRLVREAVGSRIGAAFGEITATAMPVLAYAPDDTLAAVSEGPGAAIWGHVLGAWSKTDGDGNAAGFDRSTGGLLMGIDGLITPEIRLGVLAGYSHASFDVDGLASSGSSDSYHVGLYGAGQWDALRLTGGLAYAHHEIDTSRSVAFPGFSDSLSAEYGARTVQVFGEAGYRIDTRTASFEPFVGLAHVSAHSEGFAETGGPAALTAGSRTTDTTFTTIGLHASTEFDLNGMPARAHGTLGWRHAFGDTTPSSTHEFAGGDAFTVAGVPIAQDAAVIGAGLDLGLTEAASLGFSYHGQIAGDAHENGFAARLNVRF